MRRISSAALTAVMAFSLLLTFTSTAQANAIAGGGNSSSYSGESVFTNLPAGASGQFSVIFFNDGSTTWQPGVVGLLVCAADKVTCNVASPNAAYASGWFSSTVYATVSTTVAPGQNGFFIWNFTVPAGTPAGTAATFNGDVGFISSGLEFRPQGYFQINTTPSGTGGLTLTPSSASLPVGGTQQFTASGASAGATISWSVTGGCGAVTNAGLFAATATNSATQPCNVVASSSDGLTAIAPISVFGPATQIACTATPSTATGNGADTIVVTGTLKDANGNTVTNASGTTVTFNNNTPGLLTPTAQQLVGATNGAASVTYTTVSGTSGTGQVSLSSGSLTGCNSQVTINAVGAATKTVISFSPSTIAADGISQSRLRVDVTDANGNRVTSDNSTQITATLTSGAGVCSSPSAALTASSGRVNFYITATTTPGTCTFTITTNNTSIAGGTANLTTVIVGAPNKLSASVSQSPATVGCDPSATLFSCPFATVTLQDANGNRETGTAGQAVPVTASWVLSSNAGTGCPSAMTLWNGITGTQITTSSSVSGGVTTVTGAANTGTGATTAGRITFSFGSTASTTGCTITFSDGTNVSSTSGVVAFNAGASSGVSCSFSPNPIANDGSAQSTGTVRIVDSFGNATGVGSFSVSFSKTGSTASGGAATTLLTSSPQTSSNGTASFTVKSAAPTTGSTAPTLGTDTYTASATVTGTTASTNTCTITTQ
jgi:invasin-like protein